MSYGTEPEAAVDEEFEGPPQTAGLLVESNLLELLASTAIKLCARPALSLQPTAQSALSGFCRLASVTGRCAAMVDGSALARFLPPMDSMERTTSRHRPQWPMWTWSGVKTERQHDRGPSYAHGPV